MNRQLLTRKTPLKRRSTKRARQLRQYSVRRKAFLESFKYCFCCTREATDIHHKDKEIEWNNDDGPWTAPEGAAPTIPWP